MEERAQPFSSSRSSRQAAALIGRLLYLMGGIAGIIGLISVVRKHSWPRVTDRSYHSAPYMIELTLTAIFEEAEEGGFTGYFAELPGANTQGETIEEVRANLNEAIELILISNREEFEKSFSSDSKVTRETLVLRSA